MKDDVKIVYMDLVDWQEEVEAVATRIYPSLAVLKKNRPCCLQCGITKLEIKLIKIVRKQNFNFKNAKPFRLQTKEELKKISDAAKIRIMQHMARELMRFSEEEREKILQMAKEL